MGTPAVLRRWFGDYVVAIVVAMVVVVPLLRFDNSDHVVNRNVALELMGVLLWCVVLARVEWRRRAGEQLVRFLGSGMNTPALLFFGWALISALQVAPAGVGRAFAMNELLRLGTGVLVYLVVANHVENQRQLVLLVDALLLIVACATLYRIFVPEALPEAWPMLVGGRLLLGGFLCLLLPVVAAVAAAPFPLQRQSPARAITILMIVCLCVTLTRSAWFGAVAGMLVFGALALRHLTAGVRCLWTNRYQALYPLAILAGGLVLVLTLSDLSFSVSARAQTLKEAVRHQDSTFEWRLRIWKRALGAIAQRPLLGLGLGNYVLEQRSFSQHGQTAAAVLRNGASMDEQVHNEYLHIAAELGLPGLFLYLLLLFTFFAKSLHALERLPVGTRKILLIGCVSAIAAQAVDAVSNPAWRYPVCSLYLWLVLGLGGSLIRMAHYPAKRGAAAEEASCPSYRQLAAEGR